MSLRLAVVVFVSCLAACTATAPVATTDREPDEATEVDPLLGDAGIVLHARAIVRSF